MTGGGSGFHPMGPGRPPRGAEAAPGGNDLENLP